MHRQGLQGEDTRHRLVAIVVPFPQVGLRRLSPPLLVPALNLHIFHFGDRLLVKLTRLLWLPVLA